MKHIGYVDSEGGPLLIADADFARSWKGSETSDSDYNRACEQLDDRAAIIFSFGSGHGTVWDRDPGTTDVFISDFQYIVLVGAVLDEDDEDENSTIISYLASIQATNSEHIGEMDINSGVIAILWSSEDGDYIMTTDTLTSARPEGIMSADSSGVLVRVNPGKYRVTCDTVELDEASAVRCHIEIFAPQCL